MKTLEENTAEKLAEFKEELLGKTMSLEDMDNTADACCNSPEDNNADYYLFAKCDFDNAAITDLSGKYTGIVNWGYPCEIVSGVDEDEIECVWFDVTAEFTDKNEAKKILEAYFTARENLDEIRGLEVKIIEIDAL